MRCLAGRDIIWRQFWVQWYQGKTVIRRGTLEERFVSLERIILQVRKSDQISKQRQHANDAPAALKEAFVESRDKNIHYQDKATQSTSSAPIHSSYKNLVWHVCFRCDCYPLK